MHAQTKVEPLAQPLKEKISVSLEESVLKCYQCGKCTAGCPLAEDMDFTPNQILRMLQHGTPEFDEKVLRSMSIWLCLTCDTCHTRCPQEVDFPHIMDFLRSESIKRKMVNPKAKEIIAFHKSFLDSVRLTGRLYEVGLIAGYKMRTMNLLQDVSVAPKMFLKGKLEPLPHLIKGRDAIARLFKKAEEEEQNG